MVVAIALKPGATLRRAVSTSDGGPALDLQAADASNPMQSRYWPESAAKALALIASTEPIPLITRYLGADAGSVLAQLS